MFKNRFKIIEGLRNYSKSIENLPSGGFGGPGGGFCGPGGGFSVLVVVSGLPLLLLSVKPTPRTTKITNRTTKTHHQGRFSTDVLQWCIGTL